MMKLSLAKTTVAPRGATVARATKKSGSTGGESILGNSTTADRASGGWNESPEQLDKAYPARFCSWGSLPSL